MALYVYDTVEADQVEVGDYISVGGYTGEVDKIAVNPDDLTVWILDEDEYGDVTTLVLEFDEPVDLLTED